MVLAECDGWTLAESAAADWARACRWLHTWSQTSSMHMQETGHHHDVPAAHAHAGLVECNFKDRAAEFELSLLALQSCAACLSSRRSRHCKISR